MKIVDGLQELPKLLEMEETEKGKQSDQSDQLSIGYHPKQEQKNLQAWNLAGNLEAEEARQKSEKVKQRNRARKS